MRVTIGLVGVVFLAFPLLADQPERKAWLLTIEQRLAQRFDPEDIEKRRVAYGTEHPAAQKQTRAIDATAEKALVYVIDGRRNPELFLPHELFDLLVSGLTTDQVLQHKQRSFYGPFIRAMGLDEGEFWRDLSTAAGRYVQMKYGDLGPEPTDDARCRARHEALQLARQAFGYEQFDRILYTVVAPTAQYSAASSGGDPAVALRRAEEGCQ